MKRSDFNRVIVAIAMMLIGWLPSLAHDFEVEGIFYSKTSDNTVAVTYKGDYTYSYDNEYAGDVVIPSSVDYNGITYSVTNIGNNAFSGCSSLTSIVIPNSVTGIGYGAFYCCDNLTSIEIPNSVTSIGQIAFENCTNLTDVVIGNSVTSIGNDAFADCSSLTSIVVDPGNTKYDSRNGCNAIIETDSNTLIFGCGNTIIPNSVTSIGDWAFADCSSLTNIQIPNSVTSIGQSAFKSCTNLTDVVIGNSVTSIGQSAFKSCTNLTDVVIGNNVTSIGDDAFRSCESLTSIQIPNSVTNIGSQAFLFCSSLTSIEIPNSVTSIGQSAFKSCTNLTDVVIGNSVTSIGDWVFSDCKSLTNIGIPNSVTSIGQSAFKGCSNLTDVVIGNSVTSIGESAFKGCSNLTDVAIGNSVTSIGDDAFRSCESLTSIQIPNSVTNIGSQAFSGCTGLTNIDIPNNLTSIGMYAFKGCSSLTRIVVDTNNNIYDSRNGCNAIIETATNALITGCQNTIIPKSVTSIKQSAFEDCSGLISIEIPNSVTWIGNSAFKDCIGLTSIEIPYGVTCIDCNVFDGCTDLTSIEIPNSVTCIGLYAFRNCTSLTSIEIPNSVTSIEYDAFRGCLLLNKITCLAINPPTIKSNTFSHYSASLYVPAGSMSAYQSAKYWKNFNITELPPILSNSITLDKYNADMKVGETITLNATILPENVTNKTVEWTSSDETIVVVDENGMITAIEVGEATITATTTDGTNLSASCKVIVQPTLATSITLNETEIKLEATETATLVAIVLPELTTDKSVAWSSLDETVAVVDENGMVTAISVGETTITVTTVDGTNLSASCKVNVIQLAESIILDKTKIILEATETATLVATVLPELTTDKFVKWSSSDEMVAIVDEKGVVTAISLGEATIIATTTDGSNLSAICQVAVVPTLAVYIELDQTEASIEEKSELQLTATILPEHATNKEVAWSSSDKWVATVDNTGLVTIYAAGEVIITATTTDGTNLSSTCRINVYSGIDGVNGDDVIVATVGDNIVVKNAPLGSVVNVYASNGALVATEVVTDGDVVVETPIKGIYIVSVNGKNFKVVVK